MELTGADGRLSWRDLLRPGPVLALVGLVVLGICIIGYAWNSYGVDPIANPEVAASASGGVKYMLYMLIGVVMIIVGALLSFVDFSRRP